MGDIMTVVSDGMVELIPNQNLLLTNKKQSLDHIIAGYESWFLVLTFVHSCLIDPISLIFKIYVDM